MALVEQQTADFFSASGVPDDDTKYNKLAFGFKSEAIKIIVTAGSLEVSMNASDNTPYMTLAVGQYDFVGLNVPRLYVRDTSATAQILAWAGE